MKKKPPGIGTVFKLTLVDVPENQPMAIVKEVEANSEGWQYQGEPITGSPTRSFKLVTFGDPTNEGSDANEETLLWDELINKLKNEGKIPQGPWMKAYKAEFAKHDGKSNIVVADASWVSPDGQFCFLFAVSPKGILRFASSGVGFNPGCRFLVEVEEPVRDQASK